MTNLIFFSQYVVRACFNACNSPELHHTGNVPALRRRQLREKPLQNITGKLRSQAKRSYFYRTCWMKIDFIFLPAKCVFMPRDIKENCKNISSKLWLIFLGPMPVTFVEANEDWRVSHDTNFYASHRKKGSWTWKKTVINSRLYVNFMQKYKLPNQRSAVHYESVYLSAA